VRRVFCFASCRRSSSRGSGVGVDCHAGGWDAERTWCLLVLVLSELCRPFDSRVTKVVVRCALCVEPQAELQ
jgi:hypothetical protein